MDRAFQLLFNIDVNGLPLFKNQLDLVNSLLNEPGSEYYVKPEDTEQYLKMQNRLRAYISQLLSSHTSRIITPELKSSLKMLIERRTANNVQAEKLVDEIVGSIQSKKIHNARAEPKLSPLDQLTNDFQKGQYISIITSRPLEIEAEMVSDTYSLRKLFFQDFLECLDNPDTPIKDYRLNFPVESSCHLFWKGINKILVKHLKKVSNKRGFLDSVMNKIGLDINVNSDLFSNPEFTDGDIHRISHAILHSLRKECKLVVFHCDAPLFTLPLIVIDPAETKTAKIYAIVDHHDNNFRVHKFSNEEVVLWRLFVWDKIQSTKYRGVPVDFDAFV